MAVDSFKELINSDKPTLVDFSAKWCGPCQMLEPILDDLKGLVGDNASIIKIDVDKNKKLARGLQVQGVPTLMIFQKGELKWRGVGVMPSAQLKTLIDQHTETIGV